MRNNTTYQLHSATVHAQTLRVCALHIIIIEEKPMAGSRDRVKSRIAAIVNLMDEAKNNEEFAQAQDKFDALCVRLADDAHLSKYRDDLIEAVRHIPGMPERVDEIITHLIARRIRQKPLFISVSRPQVSCRSAPASARC
jgi:hypothetical protein